jgi:hypothetical protein
MVSPQAVSDRPDAEANCQRHQPEDNCAESQDNAIHFLIPDHIQALPRYFAQPTGDVWDVWD